MGYFATCSHLTSKLEVFWYTKSIPHPQIAEYWALILIMVSV